MEIKELREGAMPLVKVSGVSFLDVGKTFDCGQCFRFDRVESSRHQAEYAGVAFGRHVSFATEGDTLYVYNSSTEDFYKIWHPFLCLDMDYAAINEDILRHSRGTVMEEAMKYGKGIRILRQDATEAVISFIVSQNNNIPRIKKIIEALCECCGQPIQMSDDNLRHTSGRSSLSAFPSAASLCELGEPGLYDLKTGFRAKYIYDAAQRIHSGSLLPDALRDCSTTAECIDSLCAVKGIGLKVASCAALFGMARYDAFPVDVWMKRVAEKYFPEDVPFSGERFGKYAGIAQQYLFYYERYQQS